MRALDLFSGMGWGIACERLHIHECGADTHDDVIATRDARHMCTPHRDVSALPSDIAAGYDLLIASPPCQTFSIAGAGEGSRALGEVQRRALDLWETGILDRSGGDPRTWLVLEPLRIALISRTPYVAWEQVPTVLPFFELCARMLDIAGYSTWTGFVYAETFGVPQVRKRAIMIARNDGMQAAPPVPTHSRYYSRVPAKLDPGVLPWVSMADALGWGMTARPAMTVLSGGTDTGGAEPFGNAARQGMAREYEAGRWLVRTSYGQPKDDPRNGHHTLDPHERPSHTVTTKAGDWVVTDESDSSRRITVAEAATLQSFPPELWIAGRAGKQFQQIGNAVPPLMGQAILAALVPALAVAAA